MNLQCPECKLDLTAVESGSVTAHRCPRCRGIWLDPSSFQRLCEEESPPPDEETALAAARSSRTSRPEPRLDDRVRYRACPACGEVMNRSNFGRVSGVVIDVCRAHGAWFDRGELAAIRRFLRAGGLRRYALSRQLSRERRRAPWTAAPWNAPRSARGASLDEIYEVLVGGSSGLDVPSRIPRLLVAAVYTALGGWLLWSAFHSRHYYLRRWAAEPLLGLFCLYLAWRAVEEWMARRRR
jgi:Zn-finger nucleic acid-binding protein